MFRQLVLAAVLCLAAPVLAQAQLLTSEDPEHIATILREEGQVARVTTDSVGDPMIETSVDGIDYRILFYDCTANTDCQSIAFWTWRTKPGGFDINDGNRWNSLGRYTKVYRDSDGDAAIEMDIYLGDGGITRQTFTRYLGIWNTDVRRLVTFVDTGRF